MLNLILLLNLCLMHFVSFSVVSQFAFLSHHPSYFLPFVDDFFFGGGFLDDLFFGGGFLLFRGVSSSLVGYSFVTCFFFGGLFSFPVF